MLLSTGRRAQILDDDEDATDGLSVSTVASMCSKASKVSREVPGANDTNDTMVISINAVKRSLGIDPLEMSRSRQALESESLFADPSAAHALSDDKARRRGATEKDSALTTQDVRKEQSSAKMHFQPYDGRAAAAIRGQGSLGARGGGVHEGDTDGDSAVSWEQQVQQRILATRLLITPTTVTVQCIIRHVSVDEELQLPLVITLFHHGPSAVSLCVDTIFEEVIKQTWGRSCPVFGALPEKMVVARSTGPTLSFRAGEIRLHSTN